MNAKIVTDGIALNPATTSVGTKKNFVASFLCTFSHIKDLFKKII